MWGGQFLFLLIITNLKSPSGATAFAAHMVGIELEAITYLPAIAFGQAAATVIGQSLGANKPARAIASGDRGQLRLDATFDYDGPLNLATAQLLVDDFLFELDSNQANGELIPGPEADAGQLLVLGAESGARERKADYRTPPGEFPEVSIRLQRTGGDKVSMKLVVSGAEILAPSACSGHRKQATTELQTDIRIIDGANPPVDLQVRGAWACQSSGGEVRRLKTVNRGHGRR